MRLPYSLLFCSLLFSAFLQAETYQGYLITKNNIHLTGFFSTIDHNEGGSNVAFINDFGDVYSIHPALVQGFAFRKGEDTHLYVSRREKRRWVFLRLIYKGDFVSLMQAPENRTDSFLTPSGVENRTVRFREYWVETPNRTAFPVRRVGFRKEMRKFCERGAPRLAEKIGKAGFRYRNIREIIEAYELERRKRKRKI